MTKEIHVFRPNLNYEAAKAVRDVIKSGWLVAGPKTHELENLVKKKIKSKNVIAVNSCTSGIFAALIAMGAKKNDEVITPSNTYISTIHTLNNLGLKIKFCDIEKNTLNVNHNIFEKSITRRTKFFIPVHNNGNPVEMPKILKIAKKNNIQVIDDAATAFGAKIKKKYIGTFANSVTVFSLHGNKVITSGEGGLVCCSNNILAKKIRTIINSGLVKDTWKRSKEKNYRILNSVLSGYKLNFNDILASIAITQVKKINEILKYREKLKKAYIKQLLPLIQKSIIKIPSTSKKNRSGLYNFPIIINSKDKNTRNKLAEHLQQNRIFTAIHYTPAHTHSFYKKKFKLIKLPVTNYIFDRILSLPFHNGIKTRDAKIVSKNISNFFMNKL
jgi:perosamine synthetase